MLQGPTGEITKQPDRQNYSQEQLSETSPGANRGLPIPEMSALTSSTTSNWTAKPADTPGTSYKAETSRIPENLDYLEELYVPNLSSHEFPWEPG